MAARVIKILSSASSSSGEGSGQVVVVATASGLPTLVTWTLSRYTHSCEGQDQSQLWHIIVL